MVFAPRLGSNGFGNEFFQIAKAYVCSQALGQRYWPVRWGSAYSEWLPRAWVDPSGVRHAARAARYALRRPRITFGEAEQTAAGESTVEAALQAHLDRSGLDAASRALVWFDGLAPGLECLESHGPQLHSLLLSSPALRSAVNRAVQPMEPRALWIGVHIRRGDFRAALPFGQPWPEGVWNLAIPLEWYDRLCRLFEAAFPGRVRFYLATNGDDDDLRRFAAAHDCQVGRTGAVRNGNDLVDLLALARCDVIVGSVSWFTGWASVFARRPVFWYACAHGAPRWGRGRMVPWLEGSALPDPILNDAQRQIEAKACAART